MATHPRRECGQSEPCKLPNDPVSVQQKHRSSPLAPCPCCGRTLALTFHHLIPRKLHRRSFFRRRYSRAELVRGFYLCRLCHDGIHNRYSEVELGRTRATPELLLEDPELQRHFNWVARQRVR